MKFAEMTIDGQTTVGAFYNEDETWNGWRCPIIEVEAAIEWLKATQANEKEYFSEALSYEWNPVSKIVTVWLAEADYPEEYQAFQRDGYEGWFVSLGAFCWTWDFAS
jgi:hypothetical protein